MLNRKNLLLIVVLFFVVVVVFGLFVVFLREERGVGEQNVFPEREYRDIEKKEISALREFFVYTNKNRYGLDDEIKVFAIVENSSSVEREWQVVYYYKNRKVGGYSSIGEVKKIKLIPGNIERVDFLTLVTDNFEPGDYEIKVDIMEDSQLIASKVKLVKVEGVKKNLDATLEICSSFDCISEKVIFLKDESIYILVKSDEVGLNVSGEVRRIGDEEWESVNLEEDGVFVMKKQEGVYDFVVNISKDGYRDLVLRKKFSVIEFVPSIKSGSKCKVDGVCELLENAQNCPQDCVR